MKPSAITPAIVSAIGRPLHRSVCRPLGSGRGPVGFPHGPVLTIDTIPLTINGQLIYLY